MIRFAFLFLLSILVYFFAAQGFAQDTVTITMQGIEFGKEGKWNRAIRAFKQATDLDPDYAPAYYNMGVAYEKTGKTVEALDSYKKAVESDPDYIAPHINLATLYNKSRKYKEAIEEMEKVLDVDSENATAHYSLGYLYCQQKQYERAWEHARKAEALKHPQAKTLLSELQDQTRKGKNP